jgi:hypothetical protein
LVYEGQCYSSIKLFSVSLGDSGTGGGVSLVKGSNLSQQLLVVLEGLNSLITLLLKNGLP